MRFLIIFLLFFWSINAYSMSEKEKQLLVKNVFLSEVSYKIIEDRLQTETNPKVIADYQKKLDHDKQVLGIWINKLKNEGVDIYSTDYQTVRQQILDNYKQEQQAKIDKINQDEQSIVTENGKLDDSSKADYDKEKAKINSLATTIDNLKQEKSKWDALKTMSLQ